MTSLVIKTRCTFPPRVFLSLTGIIIYLFVIPFSAAAEFRLTPHLTVSEEYTDNIREFTAHRQEEFISRAQPGFSLVYNASRIDLNVPYSFDYRHYAKGTRGDEYTHSLAANGKLTVIENLFFIEA